MIEIIIALVVGFIFSIVWTRVAHYVATRRMTRAFSPVPYDTRIDSICDMALDRYRLNKAINNPDARNALKGTLLYDKAAPVLGWED